MKIFVGSMMLALLFGCPSALAQEAVSQDATQTEEQKKAKEENARKASGLLDQIIGDAQLLRLTENRVRIQTSVADLLWNDNEGRARTLFSQAAEGVVELQRANESAEQNRTTNADINEVPLAFNLGINFTRVAPQLRQELIMAVARHDAQLAYQLLAMTRPAASTGAANQGRSERGADLEERLLTQIAAVDPKLALQNAEQYLDKGEFPRTLGEVLAELQRKDKEAAAKLEEKMIRKLRSANFLTSNDAGSLVVRLLQPGPKVGESKIDGSNNSTQPLLAMSTYQELLGLLVDAALKTNAPANATANNQRGRGRGNAGGFGRTQQSELTPAQIEQANARRLVGNLSVLTSQIEQYLPARAVAVREKFSEFGMSNRPQFIFGQAPPATSTTLLSAASNAPPALQQAIYLEAAMKALDEGKPDQARQIATDHLDASRRDTVLRSVEFRQLAAKVDASQLDQVRTKLAGLANDNERVDLLLQLAENTRRTNPELAVQFVDEARQFTNKRATNYQQLEQQIKVAGGYRELDPQKSFETLEPGIIQLNELLSAASVLSGFEIQVFRGGELPMQSGNGLTEIVRKYSQEIGRLSLTDFDRAQTLANRFQFAEARIVARMAISRSLLGIESSTGENRQRRSFGRWRFN